MSDAAQGRFWRLWWGVRMFGHAVMQREWDDPRVQATVKEKYPYA